MPKEYNAGAGQAPKEGDTPPKRSQIVSQITTCFPTDGSKTQQAALPGSFLLGCASTTPYLSSLGFNLEVLSREAQPGELDNSSSDRITIVLQAQQMTLPGGEPDGGPILHQKLLSTRTDHSSKVT